MSNRFVYVIDSTVGHVKIGISHDPNYRFDVLRVAMPFEMKLAWSAEYDCYTAMKIERRVHKELRRQRTQGEWFQISIDEAIQQVEAAAEHFNAHPLRPKADTSKCYGVGLSVRLAKLRLPIRALARICGVHYRAIEEIILGRTNPLPKTMEKLERGLLMYEIDLRNHLIALHGAPKYRPRLCDELAFSGHGVPQGEGQ